VGALGEVDCVIPGDKIGLGFRSHFELCNKIYKLRGRKMRKLSELLLE
jgi:hypothetical protein